MPVVMVVVQALSAPLVVRADAHQEAVGRSGGVSPPTCCAACGCSRASARRTAAAAAYRRASGTALDAALAATRLRSAYTGLTFTVAGGVPGRSSAWIGGRQALDGEITVGELVAAIGPDPVPARARSAGSPSPAR